MMAWRMLLSVSLVAILSHVYLGWRLLMPIRVKRSWRVLLWLALGAVIWLPVAANVAYRLFFDQSGSPVFDLAIESGMTLLGLFAMLVGYQMMADAVWSVGWMVTRVIHRRPSETTIRRARQLTTLLVAAAAVISLSLGLVEARQAPVIENVTIPLKHLPKAFDGFTIVQLTDMHLVVGRGAGFLADMVGTVNRLKPDMVALTGDTADGFAERMRGDLAALWWLNPPWGVFHVNGNHEYYWDGAKWESVMAEFGVTVLHNSSRVFAKGGSCMIVAGTVDPTIQRMGGTEGPSPELAIKGAPPCPIKILLAHQPDIAWDAQRAGFDLVMSGHVHGGQFFPFSVVVWGLKKWFRGLYDVGGMALYVSRGTGYWGPPVRLMSPPEVTRYTLKTVE